MDLKNENIETTTNIENITPTENIIKHLVLSGGGVVGFSFYGLLRETNKRGLWDISNIETIYGTSVGSIISVFIALHYEWDTLDDFIIKRPWQNVYKLSIDSFLYAFHNKGILDKKIMEHTFSPLFKGKDIDINVTMKEFYEITKIEMHIMTVDINTYDLVDISYKTHPDWFVIDAVYCSCCLPILFQPIIKDNMCFCDGGFMANYPVKQCIENGAKPNEIFGMCRSSIFDSSSNINDKSTLFDYILNILYKTISKILNKNEGQQIYKEAIVNCPPLSIYDIYETASSMEKRLELIQKGSEYLDKIIS
uniref:PNPLA domain-containing protein n=1 Tax=viral metagenome TaxID=1070528 RepID=A0A6C0HC69_9ZZZZ